MRGIIAIVFLAAALAACDTIFPASAVGEGPGDDAGMCGYGSTTCPKGWPEPCCRDGNACTRNGCEYYGDNLGPVDVGAERDGGARDASGQ